MRTAIPLRSLEDTRIGRTGVLDCDESAGETEELGDESGFCDHIFLRHPPNSTLADHGYRFNTLERSPGALERVVTPSPAGYAFSHFDDLAQSHY